MMGQAIVSRRGGADAPLTLLSSCFSNQSLPYDLTDTAVGAECLIMGCSAPARLAVIHSVPYNGQVRCIVLRVGESGTLQSDSAPVYKLRSDGLCVIKTVSTQTGGTIGNTSIAIFG